MRHDPGQPFRPSNSDDGLMFTHHYCNNCTRGKYEHTQDDADNPCLILSTAFMTGEAPEWVYDEDGDPSCTAFRPWKWGQDIDGNWNDPPIVYPPDPNQTIIPFP